MSNLAYENEEQEAGSEENLTAIRPVPRISIQAFCDTEVVAKSVERAAEDRRMAKAHLKVHMGGIPAAAEFYESAPTPNLIIVESKLTGQALFNDLDSLADVCDPGSKVVVIGHTNDVQVYRELVGRGVSEYLVAPVSMSDAMTVISDLFVNPDADPLGSSIAFIGARGGVGSSTIAHNVAWTISTKYESDVVLGDMDLAFGTANINFDQDPAQGIAEAIFSSDRIDDTYLDRLLAKCSERLSLLAAPSTLDRTYDFEKDDFSQVIEIAQRGAPTVVLDVPHMWTGWTMDTMINSDVLVITATPDLASLRNTKNLIDTLSEKRPNDNPPLLIMNQCNMPKRPEISIPDFCGPLGIDPLAVIQFDPALFGTAANNGQMIVESDVKSEVVPMFETIAQVVTGRGEIKELKKKSGISPFFEKLRRKK